MNPYLFNISILGVERSPPVVTAIASKSEKELP